MRGKALRFLHIIQHKDGTRSVPGGIPTRSVGTIKIVNLNLNSNGYPQPYMRAPMMMKAASMDSAPVTPEVEAGTSQVSMTADGSIEVLMP